MIKTILAEQGGVLPVDKKYVWLRDLMKYLVLLCVAVGFMAVCSLSTTPLLRYSFGQDSSFFILVGQGMRKGLLPYRDFFDMKGPYFFLLQYLGQLIRYGRTGAFLVQCGCFFVTLLFADKILCLFHPTGRISVFYTLILLIPAAYVFSYTMTGGNLTEELSLPLLMASLFFCVKYLKLAEIPSHTNQDHPLAVGFFYGVVFGCMCMIRITNAALVGAILFTISVNLICKGRWKNLILNGCCFILGTAAAWVPAILWAMANGILEEMLFQVFRFGSMYSGEISLWQKFLALGDTLWPCLFGPMLPLAVLCVYRVKNWRYWLLFVSSFALLLLAVAMGNAYGHYFVLGLPIMVFASGLFVHYSATARLTPGRKRLRIALVLLLTAASLGVQWKLFYVRAVQEINYGVYCMRTHDEDRTQFNAIREIKAQLPEGDTVFVYGMTSCSNWYAQAGLLPPNKYCDWQEHYIELMPEIGDSLVEYLSGDSAKWVVLERGSTPEPEQIREALDQNFVKVFENDLYVLLGRKKA